MDFETGFGSLSKSSSIDDDFVRRRRNVVKISCMYIRHWATSFWKYNEFLVQKFYPNRHHHRQQIKPYMSKIWRTTSKNEQKFLFLVSSGKNFCWYTVKFQSSSYSNNIGLPLSSPLTGIRFLLEPKYILTFIPILSEQKFVTENNEEVVFKSLYTSKNCVNNVFKKFLYSQTFLRPLLSRKIFCHRFYRKTFPIYR